MLRSKLHAPMLREDPADADIASHRLMLRAGLIRQSANGLWSWLPLGKLVLDAVARIVREEMICAGAQDVQLPIMQPADLWRRSGRWGAFGTETLHATDRRGRDLIFSPSAEEAMVELLRADGTLGWRQLPLILFQTQWKFRDEIRPRFGIMRAREFLMKDAYSFDIDEAAARRSYAVMFAAYARVFRRLGLTAIPVRAATGAMGGLESHEFHVLAETGESAVAYDPRILTEPDPLAAMGLWASADGEDPGMPPPAWIETARGIEIGHVFLLGDRYTRALGLEAVLPDGGRVFPVMGCYGIGISRIVGAIVEVCHDARGIVWPAAVAPFAATILPLVPDDDVMHEAHRIHDVLEAAGRTCLLDEREVSAGIKLAEADLLGLPLRIVISRKGLARGTVEVTARATGTAHEIPVGADIASVLAGMV